MITEHPAGIHGVKAVMCRSIMRRLLLLFLVLFCCLPAPAFAAAEPGDKADAAPRNILFVGNSFTYFNNSLHGHLRKLLAAEDPSTGDTMLLKAMTISGAVLAHHEGGLGQMLETYPWDVVVLQGHSLEAVDPVNRPGLKAAAKKFTRMIREHDAEPVLFMTWAYSDRPEMTADLRTVYKELGIELGVRIVPVGLAFADALRGSPGLKLHDPDKIHPSRAASYLAACVFYAALFGKSPAGIEYSAGLDEDLALSLQQSAWRTVSNYP